MPDLTRVMTCTCISNISWSKEVDGSAGTKHMVTFNINEGYQCTCAHYRFRGKDVGTCKHIEAVKKERCGWGEDAYWNTIHDEKVCPDCGEETVPFYVGV